MVRFDLFLSFWVRLKIKLLYEPFYNLSIVALEIDNLIRLFICPTLINSSELRHIYRYVDNRIKSVVNYIKILIIGHERLLACSLVEELVYQIIHMHRFSFLPHLLTIDEGIDVTSITMDNLNF